MMTPREWLIKENHSYADDSEELACIMSSYTMYVLAEMVKISHELQTDSMCEREALLAAIEVAEETASKWEDD